MNEPTEKMLDRHYWRQFKKYEMVFTKTACQSDQAIIMSWLRVFKVTPPAQKWARNCLMLLMYGHLCETGYLQKPFTDMNNIGKDLNDILNSYEGLPLRNEQKSSNEDSSCETVVEKDTPARLATRRKSAKDRMFENIQKRPYSSQVAGKTLPSITHNPYTYLRNRESKRDKIKAEKVKKFYETFDSHPCYLLMTDGVEKFEMLELDEFVEKALNNDKAKISQLETIQKSNGKQDNTTEKCPKFQTVCGQQSTKIPIKTNSDSVKENRRNKIQMHNETFDSHACYVSSTDGSNNAQSSATSDGKYENEVFPKVWLNKNTVSITVSTPKTEISSNIRKPNETPQKRNAASKTAAATRMEMLPKIWPNKQTASQQNRAELVPTIRMNTNTADPIGKEIPKTRIEIFPKIQTIRNSACQQNRAEVVPKIRMNTNAAAETVGGKSKNLAEISSNRKQSYVAKIPTKPTEIYALKRLHSTATQTDISKVPKTKRKTLNRRQLKFEKSCLPAAEIFELRLLDNELRHGWYKNYSKSGKLRMWPRQGRVSAAVRGFIVGAYRAQLHFTRWQDMRGRHSYFSRQFNGGHGWRSYRRILLSVMSPVRAMRLRHIYENLCPSMKLILSILLELLTSNLQLKLHQLGL